MMSPTQLQYQIENLLSNILKKYSQLHAILLPVSASQIWGGVGVGGAASFSLLVR